MNIHPNGVIEVNKNKTIKTTKPIACAGVIRISNKKALDFVIH